MRGEGRGGGRGGEGEDESGRESVEIDFGWVRDFGWVGFGGVG